jgi:hypothetical protein
MTPADASRGGAGGRRQPGQRQGVIIASQPYAQKHQSRAPLTGPSAS